MKRFSHLISLDKEFSHSLETLFIQSRLTGPLPIVVNGLTKGATVAYICEAASAVCEAGQGVCAVFASDESERDRICAALTACGIRAAVYKPRDFIFNNVTASHDSERERLLVLHSLLTGGIQAVVTTPSAALCVTMPRKVLKDLSATLEVGVEISPELLCGKLDSLGYKRCELVEAAGQYARRGGIVDFYTDAEKPPVRVEFFGDEIDRMVSFDVITQRAVENVEKVTLLPAVEVIVNDEGKKRVLFEIEKLEKRASDNITESRLSSERQALESGLPLDSRDKYLGLIYDEEETLLNYLTEGKVFSFIVGTTAGEERLTSAMRECAEAKRALVSSGLISDAGCRCFAEKKSFEEFLKASPTAHINPFAGVTSGAELSGIFGFRARKISHYGGNMRLFFEDISVYKKAGYKTVVCCENHSGAKSLMSSLAEEGIEAFLAEESFDLSKLLPGQIALTVGYVTEGFELISPKVALLSTARDEGAAIMAERRKRRIMKKVGGAAQRLMSYADLTVGDYVVHANYGIGIFEGLSSVRVDGVTKDYITIRYAGTDKLFVPCDRLELVGKYIGERDKDGGVKLSKMGGAEWNKTKARAKSAAKDIAKKLIELYAKRQKTPGFAYLPDSEMEEEFAADFEHEETESQARAIEEIKGDMMRPVPMNRLLCGDVGFGKTEVALRAAFKAIMCGKQVALLVPTTILALQHFQTAVSRMRSYAANVEMLTRFKTPKEQSKILDGLKRGTVDMIIGTHKLLSKKIEFRDLGLLIIDEEQRFGVAQKEKLKEISVGVDVLTLTATPIPRTLNMAMSGISDMSVLDEAPEDRRPVQTYVLEHNDDTLFEAMRKELLRGGQTLYLHNNTETISYVAGKILKEIPEARVAYAHGQMEREELEDIWQSLVRCEIDILVCTTIIETGVDLPNANTLIIENADKMGLSQLHQIRGRVGRSHRQAYAYFTYRQGKALSEIAQKRLSAIREYAEFGAGFKVALRDLEIRGAGNILGEEQHGYIDSVGYDLYVKLLEEAVAQEKGEVTEAGFESVIDFKVNANIPENYIHSAASRMEFYKKISLIETPADAADVYDELSDRFGKVPRSVERLLHVALSRVLAAKARISRVELRDGKILFRMDKPDLAVWSEVLEKHRGKLIGASSLAPISYRLSPTEDATEACKNILTDYFECMSDKDK